MEFIAETVSESYAGTCSDAESGRAMVILELRIQNGDKHKFVLSPEHASVLGRDLIHEGDAVQTETN